MAGHRAVPAPRGGVPITAIAVRRRLRQLSGVPGSPAESAGGTSRLVRPVAVLAGVAVLVLGGSWIFVPVGVAVAVGLDRLLRRIEPPGARRQRLREAADLPLAADLLAAALRAGSPVDGAGVAVAEAVAGPLGARLGRVARALRLGAEPVDAWRPLAEVPAGDRVAAAAIRSAASGAALAGALVRVADDLRAGRSAAAEAQARRAGVLIVLPLGLCFLPAFILAGLVPVIVAVLGDVL
ncbi:type II secretion system F family protein [Micromonospora sp. LOL_023]|uniref:type II secretion system F family protein n=1 Tax=Micromonospora sp. LOL_023 TaxID=3345418 RepID=UPI003A84D6A8